MGGTPCSTNLDRLAERAAERGIVATLHPHVGTLIERPDEVNRVLDGSSIALCLDSGHLLIGGTDPAELARQRGRPGGTRPLEGRRRRPGETRCTAAGSATPARSPAGLYRPLGQGDIDVGGLITALRSAGYGGWYVLEQDTILTAAPEGEGPVADVRASVAYLRSLS